MLNGLDSKKNLLLAWRRITTATNFRYKQFFRHPYQCWGLGEAELLKDLRHGLQANWRPTEPLPVWIPKADGLHRAISLLTIEDQIVLQALANVCVEKLRGRRRQVERGHVFSNRINAPNDIFFVRPWYDCYRRFQLACLRQYQAGHHWILSFDLTAFYDTVSHDLLLHTIAPRSSRSSHEWQRVRGWLSDWCLSTPGHPAGHGIPQGPLASDLLAELFLLPVDELMIGKGHRYLRYVDDIRVFASTRHEAAQAAIDLELACRNRGLIPQATKFEIVQAANAGQVFRILPSRASGPVGGTMSRTRTRGGMKQAIGGRPLRIVDRSQLRHVLFGGHPDPQTRDKVLKLVPRHPEEIEAFAFYLRQFPGSVPLLRELAALLQSRLAYPYVRARLWMLAAEVGSVQPAWLTGLRPHAEAEWRTATEPSHRWGLCSFFMVCNTATGSPALKRRFRSLEPAFQALLTPEIPSTEFNPTGLAATLVRGPDSVAMCLVPGLVGRGMTHTSLGVQARQIPSGAQHVFRSVGLISTKATTKNDPVHIILAARYSCPIGCKWKRLLGAEYAHALTILRISDQLHDSAPSTWLQNLDSFNDIVVRKIIDALQAHGLPGGANTVGGTGKLVNYGGFLKGQHPFATTFPALAGDLDYIHQRRNRLPASHPYHLQGGTRNRHLRRREQGPLCGRMRAGLARLPTVLGFL